MNLTSLLPAEARYLAAVLRAAARRAAGDRGDIGIIGTIIMVVGFAIAATILVAAIKGKLAAWIAQIPS